MMAIETFAATMVAAGLISLLSNTPKQNPVISLVHQQMVTKHTHAVLQHTGNPDTIISQKVGGVPLLTTKELSSILVAAGRSAYNHATPTQTGYALNGLQFVQDTGCAFVATKAASYFNAHAPESLAKNRIVQTVLHAAIAFSLSSMMGYSR